MIYGEGQRGRVNERMYRAALRLQKMPAKSSRGGGLSWCLSMQPYVSFKVNRSKPKVLQWVSSNVSTATFYFLLTITHGCNRGRFMLA